MTKTKELVLSAVLTAVALGLSYVERLIPLNLLIQMAIIFETSTDYLLGLTNERRPYPRISGQGK